MSEIKIPTWDEINEAVKAVKAKMEKKDCRKVGIQRAYFPYFENMANEGRIKDFLFFPSSAE